jgi:hypothetical protein
MVFEAYKISTNYILVITVNSTTGLEAVVLSLSGTTITVNTAAKFTFAGTVSRITGIVLLEQL